jgi:hypothetical protein
LQLRRDRWLAAAAVRREILVTNDSHQTLLQRGRVAPSLDLRGMKWGLLLPLVIMANVTVAAFVWHVIDLLIGWESGAH